MTFDEIDESMAQDIIDDLNRMRIRLAQSDREFYSRPLKAEERRQVEEKIGEWDICPDHTDEDGL